MTRATSRAAYQELISSGKLQGKQARALAATIDHGPATSGEIIDGAGLGANVNLWRARFTELCARGLIREVAQRKCQITGRLALVWEATGRTEPLDPKRGHRPITQAQRDRVVKVLSQYMIASSALADAATKVIEAFRG